MNTAENGGVLSLYITMQIVQVVQSRARGTGSSAESEVGLKYSLFADVGKTSTDVGKTSKLMLQQIVQNKHIPNGEKQISSYSLKIPHNN